MIQFYQEISKISTSISFLNVMNSSDWAENNKVLQVVNNIFTCMYTSVVFSALNEKKFQLFLPDYIPIGFGVPAILGATLLAMKGSKIDEKNQIFQAVDVINDSLNKVAQIVVTVASYIFLYRGAPFIGWTGVAAVVSTISFLQLFFWEEKKSYLTNSKTYIPAHLDAFAANKEKTIEEGVKAKAYYYILHLSKQLTGIYHFHEIIDKADNDPILARELMAKTFEMAVEFKQWSNLKDHQISVFHSVMRTFQGAK